MTEQELAEAYRAQIPILSAWGDLVAKTVLARLEKELGPERSVFEFLKIPAAPRVKQLDSFLAKALRRNKGYEQPLSQITDKVGVRFVVLLLPELNTLRNIIENSDIWEFEKARDFETEKNARPNYFDYQSVHYVVHPRRGVEHNGTQIPVNITCELQVRTLLQHAYAELAHDTAYKPSLMVDWEVNRQLAKSSALVEATDEIFVSVYTKIKSAESLFKKKHELLLEAYETHIGKINTADYRLTASLLDPFRSDLEGLTKASLEQFISDYDFVGERIAQRANTSILYRNPIVLAIYYLIAHEPDLVPKKWPADLQTLEMIYSDLGISTEGRL